MTDAWEWWTAEAMAAATRCPIENVREHWPRIFEQLGHCGIQTPNVGIGVIGTTAIESASTFAPVQEGCFLGEPEPASTHRAGLAYAPYHGRGQVQLTHASNYANYGAKVAQLWGGSQDEARFDLFANPDLALDPDIAAAVIALYFRDTRALPTANYPEGYSLVEACEDQDWAWVRILVYGGSDVAGAQRIAHIATDLGPPGGHMGEANVTETVPTYDAATPSLSQNDDWSCAPTSTRWALTAWGRHPSEQWLEGSMLEEGVVTKAYGLMDASGEGLARWVTRHYGEFGYAGAHDPSVGFEDVTREAAEGRHPLVIGGRGWYHWSGVRGAVDGKLLLANPAPGWHGINQTMSREQFAYLGPFSLVRLVHAAAENGGPAPVPPDPTNPAPLPPWQGDGVGSGILDMMAADGTHPAQRVSTWLPLGVSPSDVETCYGVNGTLYTWLLTVGKGFRYRPSS